MHMKTARHIYKGQLYYGKFFDAYLRGGSSLQTWARPATLELHENGIKTDLKYVPIGAEKGEPWYISDTGYDDIVSVQQNRFGFIKFRTVDGKVDFAFNCDDNEGLLEQLRQNGLDPQKLLSSKAVKRPVQYVVAIVMIAIVVGMLSVFITRMF